MGTNITALLTRRCSLCANWYKAADERMAGYGNCKFQAPYEYRSGSAVCAFDPPKIKLR